MSNSHRWEFVPVCSAALPAPERKAGTLQTRSATVKVTEIHNGHVKLEDESGYGAEIRQDHLPTLSVGDEVVLVLTWEE